MILNFYIEKKIFSRRVEYVIRIIARRLGFPYRIIRDPEKIGEDEITISYHPIEDLDPTRTRSVINVFNSHQLSDLNGAEKSINLFNRRGYNIPLIGNLVEKSTLKGWKINQRGTYYQKGKSGYWLLPFDIFLNVFYHLSRYEEKWRHFTDETVTDYSSSILSRYEKLHVPVVDVVITYLDDIIQERLKVDKKVAARVLPWPNGEEMGVALTHDVDITRGVHLNERIIKKSQGLIYRLLGNDISYARINDSIRERDRHAWSFPELISTYKSLDYRATFFFLAKMMEGRHFRYNILSKKFKNLFKDLSNAGHEISLHPSKFAFDRPKYYLEEKEHLESAVGGKVTGMRQHYLRAKFPRLWVLAEKAGLTYDSSLGYNNQAGFRAGTTHPFQTFDVLGETPLSLSEFSLHLFEYNLPEKGENITESKKTIDRLIDEVSRYGGLLVALLHPSNFQKQPFNEIWNYLLGELKKKKIFAGTLSDHVNWRRKRDRIKVKINNVEKSDKKLQISMPDGITHLAVELFGARLGDAGKNVVIEKLKGSRYTITTPNKNISIPLEINRSL